MPFLEIMLHCTSEALNIFTTRFFRRREDKFVLLKHDLKRMDHTDVKSKDFSCVAIKHIQLGLSNSTIITFGGCRVVSRLVKVVSPLLSRQAGRSLPGLVH